MSYKVLQEEIERLLRLEVRGIVLRKTDMIEIATEVGLRLFPLQDNIQTGDRVSIKNNILYRLETGDNIQVYWI